MSIFKKNKKRFSDTYLTDLSSERSKEESKRMKKKIKIGFGHKNKKKFEEDVTTEKEKIEPVKTESIQASDESAQIENNTKNIEDHENADVFLEEISINADEGEKEVLKSEKNEEKEWPKSKRKAFIQKDIKNKPVFLEDTGEKIGTVFDEIQDQNKHLIGYKIKDDRSKSIFNFPIDQFDEDKNGLIFVPSWYTKGSKTIEKLEFKDRISPELKWLIEDNTVSDEELYKIFVKHDDKVATYIEDAVALRELLINRLKILEKERASSKDNLMDLVERRLIKDIDRRKFSEIVMEHRRKVNVLDVNIKKCKKLIKRLDSTSFGTLGKNMTSYKEKEDQIYQNNIEDFNKKDKAIYENRERPYKSKYYDLKQRYEELQETHNELIMAVEKLLNKDEI